MIFHSLTHWEKYTALEPSPHSHTSELPSSKSKTASMPSLLMCGHTELSNRLPLSQAEGHPRPCTPAWFGGLPVRGGWLTKKSSYSTAAITSSTTPNTSCSRETYPPTRCFLPGVACIWRIFLHYKLNESRCCPGKAW
eukprot:CAMPEP_0179411748 /NCGR_PEP_ID=MMETSP0799-20121207/4075_1 /TAXON_ID=46947 /ORGANISM="Geminigera cryophila, Strain CCMP2564" /LENGTH=137 /DNA_ID=CAMNT_0021183863 /DNA_START=342 /DNA_END=755 /DNA_ORIENTATION=+